MTQEQIKKYFIFILTIVIAFGFGLYYTVPKIPVYFTKTKEIKTKQESINDLKKNIELAKQQQLAKMEAETKEEKQIYQPSIKSPDSMVNFNGMLETILELAKQSGIKTKNIEFKSIPDSDLFKQNHSSSHDATLLSAKLIGTYTQLQNFLRDIYRHEYLMGVNEIKITPYESDRKLLIIDLSLALYSKK